MAPLISTAPAATDRRVGADGRTTPHWRHMPAAGDLAVAVLATVLVLTSVAVATEPDANPSGVAGVIMAVLLGAVLVVRHRWPVRVLLVSAAIVVAYHVAGYAAVGLSIPLAPAAGSAGRAGRGAAAGLVCGGLLAAAAVWRVVVEDTGIGVITADTAREAILLAAVVLLGEALYGRRALADATQARLDAVAARQEQEVRQQLAEERLRIGRDVHDIAAHTVAVINVQANVAAEALDEDPQTARAAIETVRAAGSRATAELRSALELFRTVPEDSTPIDTGLSGLGALVEEIRTAGLRVDADIAPELSVLGPPVRLAVYRIVQESLTNVLCHADSRWAGIEICLADGHVRVTVTSECAADGPLTDRCGQGIRGMTERARSAGGSLRAGPNGHGRFIVAAVLPAGRSR